MKIYPVFTMPVSLALMFLLITTGCKKSEDTGLENDPNAVIIREGGDDKWAPNTEINIGIMDGSSDWSAYPASELDVLAWTVQGAPVAMRPVIRFSALPCCGNSIPPKAAYLSLYSHPDPKNGSRAEPNVGSNNAFFIRRVTEDWTPETTTWFNQPSTTTSGQVLVPHTDASSEDLIKIDVTQIIRDIYTNGNYGIMLQLQYEDYYNSRIFCHSAYPDINKRPALTMIF